MTNRTFNWILAATVVAGAGACTREEPQTAATATPAATQPTTERDDSWISTAVQAKYYGSSDVRGNNVTVVSRDGVVTLRGAVESENAKARAVALAREVEGVKNVQDELRVQTAAAAATTTGPNATDQPTGTAGRTDDETQPGWITTKIQAQYFMNAEVKPWNVDVTTSNEGVVTLEGEVETADDKTEAVRIARATDGVSRVEDRLRVKGQPDSAETATATTNMDRPDIWLTAKVQSKYFLDDEVKGHEINVDTNNAVVTLNGTVENEAQRRQAIALARSTEGVKDVVDRLKVTPAEGTVSGEAADRTNRNLKPVGELQRPDEWITMKVQSKYFLDRDVKGNQVNVDTSKGVVTLKGTVGSDAQKQQAETIARETEGVTRVVNQLTVPKG